MLRNLEHMPGNDFIQLSKQSSMLEGDNQDVPGVHRVDIHESGAQVVTVNKIARFQTCKNVTKNARIHLFS
jgi:hypothetical protein